MANYNYYVSFLYLTVVSVTLLLKPVATDVTGTNPPVRSCLCVTSPASIDVRDSACGDVIGLADAGQCFRYTGVKLECTASEQRFEYFQLNYGDQLGWVTGDFMNIEPSSACGTVDELKIIIIGDWGELIFDSQEAVAAAMGNWSEVNNPAWILSTGDNIYPKGIRSWDDIQVDLKWRNIYYQESIRDLVWFMSLGNHDYGDWVGEEWNQVELSRHEPRWYQPHLWYDHIEQLGDHSVHFVIIDTEAFRNRINNYTDMVDWMEVTLSQSTADWKLVIGHRHVFSAGDHGPVTTDLLENLVPIMEKYNVDAYVCGHDHNLQHMRNVSGEGMDYVLSGAGGAYPYRFNLQNAEYIRQVYGIETAFFDYTFGFVTLTSRKSELVFDYYNRDNEYIYSFTRRRPSVQH